MTYTKDEILEHRRQWIAALRSGDYDRVTGYLCVIRKSDAAPVGFCCLGVAAELADVPYVNNMLGHANDDDLGCRMYSVRESGYLPREARKWLGVTTADPVVDFPSDHEMHMSTLSELNDQDWSFEEIADALDEYGIDPEQDVLRKGASK